MDAQAHLLSLGWAGPGHPLHPSAYKQKGHRGLAFDPSTANTASKTSFSTYPSNGLIKPLLVSQKKGKLGIGKRAHEPQQGNEWWLKGFEKALGDVGKSESERSSGASTPVPLPRVLKGDTGKFGALYSFFVSGGEMQGTLEEDEERPKANTGRKRKSDVLNEERKQEKEFEDVATFMAARDKDMKKRRNGTKQSADEDFKAVEAFMEARDGKPEKKRNSEQAEPTSDSPTETKEERRARRRQRRAEKATRNTTKAQLDGNISSEDEAVKAIRKAEKKKRKAEKAAQQANSRR